MLHLGEVRNAHKSFIGKQQGRRPRGDEKLRVKYTLKIDKGKVVPVL
jgi:hypothetical protein